VTQRVERDENIAMNAVNGCTAKGLNQNT